MHKIHIIAHTLQRATIHKEGSVLLPGLETSRAHRRTLEHTTPPTHVIAHVNQTHAGGAMPHEHARNFRGLAGRQPPEVDERMPRGGRRPPSTGRGSGRRRLGGGGLDQVRNGFRGGCLLAPKAGWGTRKEKKTQTKTTTKDYFYLCRHRPFYLCASNLSHGRITIFGLGRETRRICKGLGLTLVVCV